ncbi:protein kinase family protein [Streptomyces albireticuli]|uniref:aminoglycoside phosphotransferase n=1 Tax=Streptomyces albireticuli TaxID=1940 RepID=UPI0036BBEE78
MPMERLPWEQLPAGVRSAVAGKLPGEFSVEDMASGGNSAVAVLFLLADGRRVFVKGMSSDHEQIEELERERRVNAYLPACAPRLLWHMEAGGWSLLGFEGLTGTWADYATGSADLELVVSALTSLSDCAGPDGVPTAWDRWGYYCSPDDAAHLAGTRILHTDPAAVNFLVGGDHARLIDWAWTAVGPAWADTVLWATRLIADGDQKADEAYAWASHVPAFRQAPHRALCVLAEAEARSWEDHRAHGEPHIETMTDAARAWADFLARG